VAKVIGPLHSTEARGRVDSLVYNTWRGIRFVRSYIAPVFKEPDCRIAQKERVALAVAAWKLLTDAARHDWHDYAELHSQLDWTGVPLRWTGANWFISCYTRVLRVAGTPPTSPPAGDPPYPLSTWAVTQTDNNAHLVWASSTQPEAHTYYVQILKQGPFSIGRQPDFHHASIITHELLATSPYDDPLTIGGKYCYWARVLDAATGLTTPLLQACLVFSAAPALGGITARMTCVQAPIPLVTVDADGHQDITGADGIALIEGLPHGDYTVTPTKAGWSFVPATKPAHVDPPAVTDLGDWEGAEI